MGIDRGRVGAERLAEERSSGDPAAGDWDGTAKVSQYILSVTSEGGHPEIQLQTAELRGAGVASLRFVAPLEGGAVTMSVAGTDWPNDGHLVWFLPAASFDPVMALLRDGEPTLYAFTREGELHCNLAAEIKTGPAT